MCSNKRLPQLEVRDFLQNKHIKSLLCIGWSIQSTKWARKKKPRFCAVKKGSEIRYLLPGQKDGDPEGEMKVPGDLNEEQGIATIPNLENAGGYSQGTYLFLL
jgi:hypothetical protein